MIMKKLLIALTAVLLIFLAVGCEDEKAPTFNEDLRDSPFVAYKDKMDLFGNMPIDSEKQMAGYLVKDTKKVVYDSISDSYTAYYFVQRPIGMCFEVYSCGSDGEVEDGSRPLMAYLLKTEGFSVIPYDPYENDTFAFAVEIDGVLQAGQAFLITDAINILKDDKSSGEAFKGLVMRDRNGNALTKTYLFPGHVDIHSIGTRFEKFDETKHGWVGEIKGGPENLLNRISILSVYFDGARESTYRYVDTPYIADSINGNGEPVWTE